MTWVDHATSPEMKKSPARVQTTSNLDWSAGGQADAAAVAISS
jgi:hypothetical protein